MSEPRRWWVNIQDQDGRPVKRDADRLCLAGPEPEPEGHEVFIEVIEAEPVLARIKELEAQLKEANEVAKFYAKKSSWSRGEDAFDVCLSDSEGWPVSRGGTRAREYLKKWEGEK